MTRTRPVDAGIYATLGSVVMGDLLPGPTSLCAVAVGVACGIAALRHDPLTRMLFGVFIGMLLGLLMVVLAALSHS